MEQVPLCQRRAFEFLGFRTEASAPTQPRLCSDPWKCATPKTASREEQILHWNVGTSAAPCLLLASYHTPLFNGTQLYGYRVLRSS